MLSLAVVAVGMAVTGQLTHARSTSPVRSRTVDADVSLAGAKRLVVRGGSADIAVRTSGGPPGVHVRLNARGNHVEDAAIRVSRDGDDAVVTIAENRPHSGWNLQSITSTVTLRSPVDVAVSTGSGDVTAAAMPRAFDGRTGSGDVTISSPRGDVHAQAGSGNVTLVFDAAFRGSTVVATSGSGDVALTVPSGFRAALQTHTSSGTVTDDAHVVPAASPSVVLRSSSGDVRIGTP